MILKAVNAKADKDFRGTGDRRSESQRSQAYTKTPGNQAAGNSHGHSLKTEEGPACLPGMGCF